MKLRIQGDSLRLRLTKKEVASLNHDGRVQCAIHFPGGKTLGYSVVSGVEMGATYADGSIQVMLQESVVKQWAESSEVTIKGVAGDTHLLVEKDFQCLHAEKDRDPDSFPNPEA